MGKSDQTRILTVEGKMTAEETAAVRDYFRTLDTDKK
jgi:hypothetical protein